MATFQEIIDRARILMNDDAKKRFTDAKALVYAQNFLRFAKRHRPDAFFDASGAAIDVSPYTAEEDFPLEEQFELACEDYLVARAHAVDDEFAEDGKLLGFMNLSKAQMGQ